MRNLIGICGIALAVFGTLFLLQGLNIIRWPADSFMLGRHVWTLRGAAMLAVGLALFGWSRLRRGRL